jgi:hypothetical protein
LAAPAQEVPVVVVAEVQWLPLRAAEVEVARSAGSASASPQPRGGA